MLSHFFIIIFDCAGSSLLHGLFCGCGKRRLLTAVTSPVKPGLEGGKASAVAAPGLVSTGSVLVAQGLSCSEACGIFLDQGSNPCPLHWQADSLPLSHKGSPELVF